VEGERSPFLKKMNRGTVVILSLFFFVFLAIVFYLLRAALIRQRNKINKGAKETSEVGFVVDTFHELVSRLKEKEKELEALKKSAEEKAFTIEIYNENILQSVPSGVIGFDEDLRITKINSAAARILGVESVAVIGKKYSEIFLNPICEMIEKRTPVERAEFGYTTQSGKRIWLGLNMSHLRDSANEIIGQILVFTDLTELKAFQSQRELRERLFTLGEMSAGIAHELRNPLGVISGYTKILSRKADQNTISAVEAISREVTVMDRIITDFLSFAKPKDLVLTEVSLPELITGCVSAVADDMEGIRVINDTATLPVVKADEVLLRQAVTNLLQNAVESVAGGGEVKIWGAVQDSLMIFVSDTGHGIPAEIRDKIFLPFYTTKERGTGLGLSIVHKIVVSHGGTIQVDTGDRGTTFTVKLPKEMIVSAKRE
jgi:PAS domain S-box-containing protein